MRTRIFFIVAALCLGGCQTGFKGPRETSYSPSLAPAVGQSRKLGASIKRAQDDAAELRKINEQSLSLLDQLDNKVVKLLEK